MRRETMGNSGGAMAEADQITLDFTGPVMTPDEALVWDVLRVRRGKALAILGPELEARTGIRYKQLQKIISGLVIHHRKLIGSGTRGYYIPVTPDEVKDSTRYLRQRAIVALVRAARMQQTSIEDIFHQAVFEFKMGAS